MERPTILAPSVVLTRKSVQAIVGKIEALKLPNSANPAAKNLKFKLKLDFNATASLNLVV
jgi:hypothetical protein